ncbi:MAG: division/cell wall cluster transcriptional repressor MraZ [Gammaproteobacteria bacterium]|nr:division/cell wall cluster transcriptional repressor MraZ [Gammaproteobacteria bacterium]
MFRGINIVNLDAKGRMAIPTRYRSELTDEANGRLIATIDTEDSCLLLYPLPAWTEIEQKIESLPSFNRVTRRIQRLLIGHATEVELDANGRILLPSLLRDYAGLEKRVMLIGQGKKFELWDEDQWNNGRNGWLAESHQNTAELPEQLQELSL